MIVSCQSRALFKLKRMTPKNDDMGPSAGQILMDKLGNM
jgi:hypothetical protein